MARSLHAGAFVLGASLAFAGGALAGDGPTEPGRFEVELLTIEPGDDMVTAAGHSALRILDRETGDDWVYNWGTLESTEDLMLRLAAGPTNFMLGVAPFSEELAIYRAENRTIRGQGLDLPQADALRLVADVQVNSQLENREYAYDHLSDNCATRVRDVVDRYSNGALRRAASGDSGRTFRQQGYEVGAPSVGVVLLFDLIANGSWDRAASRWDAHCVPQNLYETVRDARLDDRPLVFAERLYYERQGSPPSRVSLRPCWYLLGFPVLLLLAAIFARRRPPIGFAMARASLGVLSVALGLGGAVAFSAWAFTRYPDFEGNAVLFFLWPTDMALLWLTSKARWEGRGRKLASRYLSLRLVSAGVGIVVVLTLAYQDVWSVAVPALVGLALALLLVVLGRPATPPSRRHAT